MKKVLLIWLLAAGFASAGATAQNIALGERVPELKIQTWLDNRQPEPAPTTYVEWKNSMARVSGFDIPDPGFLRQFRSKSERTDLPNLLSCEGCNSGILFSLYFSPIRQLPDSCNRICHQQNPSVQHFHL